MKSRIAVSSLLSCAVCALTFSLAHADGSVPWTGQNNNQQQEGQQSGQQYGPETQQQMGKAKQQPGSVAEQKSQRAKTCRDDNGNLFRRGQKGFDECIQSQINKELGEQD